MFRTKDAHLESLFANHTDFKTGYSTNLVNIVVYYDTLAYTRVTESPAISEVTLMSNIGGQIGLFLGMSLLGIVELIETTVYIVRSIYRINKKRLALAASKKDSQARI